VKGPFGDGLSAGEDNLVIRAVRALAAANGIGSGIALTLEKNLPIASGIGGGSADAAAALRLAAQLWGLSGDAAMSVAAGIGADVPACVISQTCFGSGVGELLEPVVLNLADTPLLLVNPMLPCPTGPVFKGWDGVDRGALDVTDWRSARNDLAAPALSLVPAIGEVLETLTRQNGVILSRMSGSGATCFALFQTEAARDAASQAIRCERPDWWTLATLLR
jgi:4-diphosphocytidyl-2-C-methyl-D-erythritol kinase